MRVVVGVNIILAIAVLAAAAALSYAVRRPHRDELTEFYVLGINGQAEDYPALFTAATTAGGRPRVLNVQYGKKGPPANDQWGRVVLGVVNHEGRTQSYVVRMAIAGEQVEIPFEGNSLEEIGPLVLAADTSWEHEIGIVPRRLGINQVVELFLCKTGGEPFLGLRLWIDVEEAGQSP